MTLSDLHITLEGLRFYAYHGVLQQERTVGAWYTVDINMTTSKTTAVETDDIDNTINYSVVTDLISREMSIPSNLLEHVAGRIAKALQMNFSDLQSLTVTISKDNPPVQAECRCASVTLRYR